MTTSYIILASKEKKSHGMLSPKKNHEWGGSLPILHLPLGAIITYMCEQHLEIVGRYMMDSVNVILVE